MGNRPPLSSLAARWRKKKKKIEKESECECEFKYNEDKPKDSKDERQNIFGILDETMT